MKTIIRVVLLLVVQVFGGAAHAAPIPVESTYERVIRTGVIRCGYTPYSVALAKDPNTGVLSGIYKDITEAIGEKLGLKIEWTEEVGWGGQIEGLNTGRYDMVCSPANITGPRSRAADLTATLYFEPVWVWARGDDTRFDNAGLQALNTPETKIATIDGEQSEAAARFYLPRASLFSAPQASDYSIMILNVIDRKADVTFASPVTAEDYMRTHPQALKRVGGDQPLYMAVGIMQIKRGEHDFTAMINSTIRELFASNVIDMVLDKYGSYPLYRVAKAYAEQQ